MLKFCVLFAFCVVVGMAQERRRCNGDNEEYRQLCGCEPSCQYLRQFHICPYNCRQGCFCRSGYYRDSSGHCVQERQCSRNDDRDDPCSNSSCGRCERCIRDPKRCFTQPCTQYRCESINDCDGNDERWGECPPENTHWGHNNDCRDRCRRDSNCSGRMKCCPSSCGRQCRNPVNNHH